MRGGTLLYKCRLCGALEEATHVPHLAIALSRISSGHPLPEDWGPLCPRLIGAHYCGLGRLGISDLIGGHEDLPKG